MKKAKEEKKTAEDAVLTPKDQKEIRVIERVIESKEIAPADAFGKLSRNSIELIKRTVAKGASDDELRLFIQVCKGANLNPFLKQAHLVPFWDSKEGIERRAIIVGVDGFRAVAESSGVYAGNDDPVFEGDEEIEVGDKKTKIKHPVKATVSVYKVIEGQRYPFSASARWIEYYPGAKKGYTWHKMPYLMLGKCAEALALRKAFPKLLSGIYAEGEMDRTIQTDSDVDKKQNGYATLLEAINTAKLIDLHSYKKQMQDSIKYTPEQKKQYIAMVDKRIAELTPVQPAEVVPAKE